MKLNRSSVLTILLLTILGLSSILASVLLSVRTVQANGDWADPDCRYRTKLTFQNSASSENLMDFPVLIVLNPSRIDYSKTSATDIRFYDGSTLLKKEAEQWNASGNSYIWVKVPQIDNSNSDYIYAYYNATSTTNLDDAATVWSGYAMVQHLEETSGTLTDSTSNGNNGTPNDVGLNTAGKIDGADYYNGSTSYANILNSASLNFGTGSFSYLFWFRSELGSATQDILDKKNGTATANTAGYKVTMSSTPSTGFSAALGNSTSYVRLDSGTDPSYGGNVWTMYTVVVDRTQQTMFAYINGALKVSKAIPGGFGSVSNDRNLTLGRDASQPSLGRYYKGGLDEVRILSGAYSADWVKAHYLSTSDLFITYGSEESSTPAPAYSNIATTATLAGSSCEFQVKWTDSNGLDKCIFATNNTGTWQNETIPVSGTESWANKTLTLTSTPGTVVGYRWYCNNTLGNTGDTGIRTLVTTGDWQYAKKLYFDNSGISENLIDFPVLINLTRAGSDFWGHVGSTVNDLRFVDSDGTTDLYFEVEQWNYAGRQGLVWVKIPQIDANSASDFIYVFYGNPSPPESSYNNPAQVWDSNFKMVQHLKETSGTHQDSTLNNNDGAVSGAVVQGTTGAIDGADDFGGSLGDYVNCGTSSTLTVTEFTLEAWIKREANGDVVTTGTGGIDDAEPIITKGRGYNENPHNNINYFLCVRQSTQMIVFDYEASDAPVGQNYPTFGTTFIENGQWYYVVATFNTATAAIYVNGALDVSASIGHPADDNPWQAVIGSAYCPNGYDGAFNGVIDEARISSSSRSAGWIKAQYLSMSDQYVTFESGEIILPIPEYLLGAITAIVACFAAYAVFKKTKTKKSLQ
jgi:hypothetical protein